MMEDRSQESFPPMPPPRRLLEAYSRPPVVAWLRD